MIRWNIATFQERRDLRTFDGNGTFRLLDRPPEEIRREAFGAFIKMEKVRCIGPVNDKGSPHYFRNGGILHPIDHFILVTDGYQLKIGFKVHYNHPVPTMDEVDTLPRNMEVPVDRPFIFELNRYILTFLFVYINYYRKPVINRSNLQNNHPIAGMDMNQRTNMNVVYEDNSVTYGVAAQLAPPLRRQTIRDSQKVVTNGLYLKGSGRERWKNKERDFRVHINVDDPQNPQNRIPLNGRF